MADQARIVIIGGGVVGCSILYHLVKAGWNDALLLERDELTAGSTWHAAGLLPLFNMNEQVARMHRYSIDLYQKLSAETDIDVGFHRVGNLRLACNQQRMDEYRNYAGIGKILDVEFEFLSPREIADLWPLCEIGGDNPLVGAIYHPNDGYIAPAELTQALATAARAGGGRILRKTAAVGISRRRDGCWQVETEQGAVICEKLVLATGNYARQTGAMLGLDVPVIPVEHQYIVTGPIEALQQRHRDGLPELPVFRESDAMYYLREEHDGMILGPYEKNAPCWAANGVPKGFGRELLPPDIDRLEWHIERAIARVPCFGEGGVKEIINGPIAYTPDGNPLIGPAWGLDGVYLAEGFSFGITSAGGAGHYLAQMITTGEAEIDMLGVDPRRFGPYASKDYLRHKNEECYEHVFIIHYPNEERPAARPFRTAPCYDRLKARGAVFGQKYGWERAAWFAPDNVEPVDHWSFRRGRDFPHIAAECHAMRDAAGLIDMSSFTKHNVSGPGAASWLDGLIANRLPGIGRTRLCHSLGGGGGVRSEFTIYRDRADSFYLVSSGAWERYDRDLLLRRRPDDGSVTIEQMTTQTGVFVLAGPKSRDILASLTDADLSNTAFPWLSGRNITVGMAPVTALRINFIGELGWELHHPIEMQNYLFDLLIEAGRKQPLAMVGMRAMASMALEKSYRNIGAELSREVTAWESGLDQFIALDKGDFDGRDALITHRHSEHKPWRFVTLAIDPQEDADCLGSEPIFSDNVNVGRTTSGGYGHRLGQSLALGFVRAGHETVGTMVSIEILGKRCSAQIIAPSPYDRENRLLRGAHSTPA